MNIHVLVGEGEGEGDIELIISITCYILSIDCLLIALDVHMLSHNGYVPRPGPYPFGLNIWASRAINRQSISNQ